VTLFYIKNNRIALLHIQKTGFPVFFYINFLTFKKPHFLRFFCIYYKEKTMTIQKETSKVVYIADGIASSFVVVLSLSVPFL
jgi:hypothetical protein